MSMQMKKAKRSLAKLKLGISGVSGSGKTMGSLLIAYGLLKEQYPNLSDEKIWEKICLIDTENSSGSLYSNIYTQGITIGEFNTIDLTAPFSPSRYIEAVEIAENAGIEVIIIDSLTHCWAGEGGSLDKQGKVAARVGNSFTAWREVTPEHNKLVDKLLQSKCHILASIRSKTEYALQANEKGKQTPVKLGMAPVFRDGIEYEFTVMFDVDQTHTATASKDRTNMFSGEYFTITPNIGKRIYKWLEGAEPEQTAPPTMEIAQSANLMEKIDTLAKRLAASMSQEEKIKFAEEIASVIGTGNANYRLVTNQNTLIKLFEHLQDKVRETGENIND